MLKDKSYKKQDDQVNKNEDITKNVSKPKKDNKIISIIPDTSDSVSRVLYALTENGDIFSVMSNGVYEVLLKRSNYNWSCVKQELAFSHPVYIKQKKDDSKI